MENKAKGRAAGGLVPGDPVATLPSGGYSAFGELGELTPGDLVATLPPGGYSAPDSSDSAYSSIAFIRRAEGERETAGGGSGDLSGLRYKHGGPAGGRSPVGQRTEERARNKGRQVGWPVWYPKRQAAGEEQKWLQVG